MLPNNQKTHLGFMYSPLKSCFTNWYIFLNIDKTRPQNDKPHINYKKIKQLIKYLVWPLQVDDQYVQKVLSLTK